MRWIALRLLVLVFTLIIGFGLDRMWASLFMKQKRAESSVEVLGILKPVVLAKPMLTGDLTPDPTNPYMVLDQTELALRPNVTEPIPLASPVSNVIEYGCVTLHVSVDSTRKVTINTREVGTLADTGELKSLLAQFFRQREEARAYKPGLELREDLPKKDRIEKTVLVQVPRSLTYGELAKLLNVIKDTGANPIALQTNDLTP